MPKFNLLAILLIYTLLSLCSCASEKETTSEKLPNILWLVCEDQSPQFYPMYGDSMVRLPNIERLAAEGIIFDKAYATVPVCAPARSAIITGMYPTSLGTHNMRTYNAYNSSNQPKIGIPSYSPVVPQGVRCFTEYLLKAGYYCTNNAKEDYNFKIPDYCWNESSNKAHWRNKEKDQPFFAVFNFGVTHESMIWVNGDKELYVDPAEVPVPPYFPDDSIVRKDLAVNYSNLIRMDQQIGEILLQLEVDSLYENTIIFFYGDHGGPFPRHKRVLYETGTRVPLIVKMPKSQTKERNQDLVNFIDFAPTLLSVAGIEPPPHMQGEAFLGKFKKSPRQHLFTTSDRFDETYDRVRAVRSGDLKYIRNYYPDKPYALSISYRENMPMMRQLHKLDSLGALGKDPSKWMADERPSEELYDLSSDSFELNNLAMDQNHKEDLIKMRTLLDEWIRSSNDLGEYKERELMDGWLVNNEQPSLNSPAFTKRGDLISIQTEPSDATILWRYSSQELWNIYDGPLDNPEMDTIIAKSVRIGYSDSKEAIFSNFD